MQNASANNHMNKPIRDVKEKWNRRVAAVHLLTVLDPPVKHRPRKVLHHLVIPRQVEVLQAEVVLQAEEVLPVVLPVLLLPAAVLHQGHHPAADHHLLDGVEAPLRVNHLQGEVVLHQDGVVHQKADRQ
jgi:hypothetical protein